MIFLQDWKVAERERPWVHVRYHSASPMSNGLYRTLHYLVVENVLDVPDPSTIILPHQTPDTNQTGKLFAACLEESDSRFFPQNYDEVREVYEVVRRITKKKRPTTLLRRDFLTRQPLPVTDFYGEDGPRPVLFDLDFKELPVRKTKKAVSLQRWATYKKNRDAKSQIA